MSGWFNPHRPRVGRITIIRRIGRTNAHRPRAPRDVSRGWNPGGGCRAKHDGGGMSPEAMAKGKTRVTKTPHRGVFYSASSSDNASPSSDSDAAILSGVAGIKSACACNLTIARTISIARCNW